MKKAMILPIIILVLSLISCGDEPAGRYTYGPPRSTDDELEVAPLQEVNLDPAPIEAAVDRILGGDYGEVHSLLIVRDGKLVLEEYFPGHEFQWDAPGYHGNRVAWSRDEPHTVMSVGKSFTSACIGIAIDQGLIGSVHQSIFDYLPDHHSFKRDGKEEITIEHLLTMTSGLKWKEWGASNTGLDSDQFRLWVDCEDQIACVLEKPVADEPGTSFTYTGGGMILLGEIIKNATGMDIEDFSAEYLFAPMGVDAPAWRRFESGVADASGGFKITPRDMAKFGMAYLNGGAWKGRQVIPEEWVEKSATPYAGNQRIRVPGEDTGKVGYAYSWWTKPDVGSGQGVDTFWAGGWGGQRIVVVPEQDTVVVFTGGNYTSETETQEILERYILRAID